MEDIIERLSQLIATISSIDFFFNGFSFKRYQKKHPTVNVKFESLPQTLHMHQFAHIKSEPEPEQ